MKDNNIEQKTGEKVRVGRSKRRGGSAFRKTNVYVLLVFVILLRFLLCSLKQSFGALWRAMVSGIIYFLFLLKNDI